MKKSLRNAGLAGLAGLTLSAQGCGVVAGFLIADAINSSSKRQAAANQFVRQPDAWTTETPLGSYSDVEYREKRGDLYLEPQGLYWVEWPSESGAPGNWCAIPYGCVWYTESVDPGIFARNQVIIKTVQKTDFRFGMKNGYEAGYLKSFVDSKAPRSNLSR